MDRDPTAPPGDRGGFLNDPGSFDPDVTHAMGIAFDHACESLQLTKDMDSMRRQVAITIVRMAMAGERDGFRLYETAMQWAAYAA